MRVRLKLFGRTVCSLLFDTGPALELVDGQEIVGGYGAYLERDPEPFNPERRTQHEYEDRRFGFNR